MIIMKRRLSPATRERRVVSEKLSPRIFATKVRCEGIASHIASAEYTTATV